MAKAATVQFACTECGYAAGRWLGKCPACGEFGTLVEDVLSAAKGAKAPPKPLLRLAEVEADEAQRIPTGVAELDRVLGGGLVPASLVLVGGEPGVGKSTLLLSALRATARERRGALVSGEGAGARGEADQGRGVGRAGQAAGRAARRLRRRRDPRGDRARGRLRDARARAPGG